VFAALLLAMCVGASRNTSGQEVSAAITGTILDPEGAGIVDAKVDATDVDTEIVYSTRSNSTGVYNLPRLPPGIYELRAGASGFQAAVEPSLTVGLNQIARVDFRLKLGKVTEAIEVTAPLLQTDTAQLNTLIDAHTSTALPLATRNYVQLTLLAPGTVHPDPGSFTRGDNTGLASGRPYINGNREQANNFLLDGMDNNEVSDNLVGFSPSVDAIQGLNVITQNASAEFGNFQGGIISAHIRSGTSMYHGNIFEFVRNDVLNANNWASSLHGLPKPALRWNMFGATFGGPIVKKRLFFFVDYQGQRFSHPSTTTPITLFTSAERRGDFSQLLPDIQLYNPFQLDTTGTRVPFPNNQIPTTMIDSVARNLFASDLYPLPTNSNLANNCSNNSRSYNNVDQGDVKVDYTMSGKDRLSSRLSKGAQDSPAFNSFKLLFDNFAFARMENGVVNWTHTFSSNVLSETRVGVNSVSAEAGGADNGGLGDVGEKLGIANGNDHGPGLLEIRLGGGEVNSFGSSNIGTQVLFASTVFQYQEGFIFTYRHHLIHTGFQYWRQRLNAFTAGDNGRTGFMSFSGRFTAGPGQLATAGGGTGAGEADFFLGLPDSFGRGLGSSGTWGHRANVFGVYFQDDWRVRSNLTLNLGLRYENHTPWVEVQNRQVNFAPISGQIQFAGRPCIYTDCRALYNSHNTGLDFQPRIGLAWTPSFLNGRTVVRGAYTISSYLEGTGINLRLPMNPPFTTPEFETDYHDSNLPATKIEQGLLPPTDPFQNAVLRLWDPDTQPAISQQWNFSLQHQLNDTTTLQIGYVGQHGTHLMVPMPYLQKQLHADGSITPSRFLSGNPELQSKISRINGTAAVGNMRYDALQAVFERRLNIGLAGQIAYTYSKCRTDSSGYYGSWGAQTTSASPYWQNLYDQRAEWGPCYYDVTHVISSYAVYELPIGKKKKWGRNLHPIINAAIGAWQVGAIVQLHGGFALTIPDLSDASGTNSQGSRANCIAPPHVFGKRPAFDAVTGQSLGFQWFDPTSYGPAAAGTFGTCGVGTVRGPGLHTADLSLQKEFPLGESKKLEFRAEFINFTNTPILNSPNTVLGPNLGLLDSSQGERNVQFALRLYY